MKFGIIVGALVIVAACVFGYLSFRDEGSEPRLEEKGSEGAESPETQVMRATPVPSPELSEKEDFDPGKSQDSGTEKPILELEDGEFGLHVRVIDRDSGEPVPAIDLYIYDDEMLGEKGTSGLPDYHEVIREVGLRYRCNAGGEAWVRPHTERALVLAYSSRLLGRAQLDATRSETVIEVVPHFEVRARVVDRQGTALSGIPVVTTSRKVGDEDRDALNFGPAVFTDVEERLARLRLYNLKWLKAEWRVFVTLRGILDDRPEVLLDPEDLSTEPVTLTMPDCGSLLIRVVDPGGLLSESDIRSVRIERVDGGSDDRSLSYDRSTTLRAQVEGLEQEIPLIGLNQRYKVIFEPGRHAPLQSMVEIVDGPTEVGASVPVTFNLPATPTRYIVLGRALDDAGEALANTSIHCNSLARDQSGSRTGGHGYTFRTDDEGRFRFVMSPLELDAGSRWWLEFSRNDRSLHRIECKLEFTGKAVGKHQLGDLVLSGDPLLASGKVVDEKGLPVFDVEVSLKALMKELAGQDDFDPWIRTAGSGKTKRDGRFEIRGPTDETRFKIGLSSWQMTSEVQEIGRGQTGIVIVAKRKAELKARIVTRNEDLQDFSQIVYRLVEAGAELDRGRGLRQDGTFSTWMDPGTYDLHVCMSSDLETPLLTRSNLQLSGGETLDLGDLELDIQGTTIEFDVQAPEGETRRHLRGNLSVTPLKEGDRPRSKRFEVGREPVSILVEALPAEVEITVPGYRRELLTISEKKTTVKLRPGLKVVLTIPGIEGFPENAVVMATLEKEGAGRQLMLERPSFVSCRDARLELVAEAHGRYRLQLQFGKSAGRGGARLSGLMLDPPLEIELRDLDGPQVFPIKLDPATLKAARALVDEH